VLSSPLLFDSNPMSSGRSSTTVSNRFESRSWSQKWR
jgi:hypothetical protein